MARNLFVALLLSITVIALNLAQRPLAISDTTTTENGITYHVRIYHINDDPKAKGFGLNWERLAQSLQAVTP